MSRQEQLGWNERYLRGEHATPLPDPFLYKLTEPVTPLPSGRAALDIACGAGRHAVWLAERGWDVVGCDVSLEGLRLAAQMARQRRVGLKLFCAELDEYPLPARRFDLVVVFFFLQRRLFAEIEKTLKPGGLLMYRTYLEGGEPTSHPQHRLRSGELPEVFPGWRVLHYREIPAGETAGGRPVAEFMAQKPGGAGA
jgi:tellurite methyltransferase